MVPKCYPIRFYSDYQTVIHCSLCYDFYVSFTELASYKHRPAFYTVFRSFVAYQVTPSPSPLIPLSKAKRDNSGEENISHGLNETREH